MTAPALKEERQLALPLPGVSPPASNGLGIPRTNRVFVNRNLSLSGIEWVGFDMDYTLAIYNQAQMDALSIELTVERNVLSVKAQRQRQSKEGVESVISERPMGVFSRQLFLGDTLDTDKLEATYDNGVLTLRIPVSDKAKPRKVSIGSGNGGRKQIKG